MIEIIKIFIGVTCLYEGTRYLIIYHTTISTSDKFVLIVVLVAGALLFFGWVFDDRKKR